MRVTRRMNNGKLVCLASAILWLGLTARAGFAQQPQTPPKPAPVSSHAPRRGQRRRQRHPHQTASFAATAYRATATTERAAACRSSAFDVARAAQNAEVAEKMIRKLQAGMMPPPLSARPDAAAHAALVARARDDSGRGCSGEAEPRRAHVPAAQSSRIRARDSRPARARRGCGQLAAARHEERELRQHRGRPGAVADAARGVSQRRDRGEQHGRRRPQRAGDRSDLQQRRATYRSTRGITSKALRSGRAAAWSSSMSFRPTPSTSSRSR